MLECWVLVSRRSFQHCGTRELSWQQTTIEPQPLQQE